MDNDSGVSLTIQIKFFKDGKETGSMSGSDAVSLDLVTDPEQIAKYFDPEVRQMARIRHEVNKYGDWDADWDEIRITAVR